MNMTEFDEILVNLPDEVVAISKQLRQIVLSAHSNIAEDILGGNKVKMAYYSIGDYNNAIAVIQPSEQYCKLFLHHTDKVDTTGFKMEGKGKHTRHIKFRDAEEVPSSHLSEIVTQIASIVAAK